VIKPALVGLAGPWISGGVEFNWPQHHRPGTFLPTDWEIEREPDGAVTVWCSDHDPLTRMKGMHGIRLRPGSSVVEARVRLYNRTEETQTFLWWANVAAAVNDDYQSFFPTDVQHVADHAKRAVATFPHVDGRYYGVDYPAQVTGDRPDGDRLDWYRNIPVPTSYMVVATDDDFFGGYDHGVGAGFVHWADRSFAPGKKQWTWGDAPFGWAWDANLTDTDGPYVELMAGAYTDNQPDFSWIAPGETKTFSQYWYPIQGIGPAQQASLEAAVRLDVLPDGRARVGVAATRILSRVTLTVGTETRTIDAAPGAPFIGEFAAPGRILVTEGDTVLVEYAPRDAIEPAPPAVASEPPAPSDIESIDELYLTAQYLEQYRHATRSPEPYLREALRRDPGDVRSNVALAARLDRAGSFDEAEQHLRTAIARLLTRVPNPADGEAHYRLGIVLVHLSRDAEAAVALGKAMWNSAWRVPAGYALARLEARRGDVVAARRHALEVLALDAQHAQAVDLLAALGDTSRLAAHLAADPLDQWARDLAGLPLTDDAPTLLDVALEYAGIGLPADALRVLDLASVASGSTALGQVQVAPLVHYHRAALLAQLGDAEAAAEARLSAATADARLCLPSRLDDVRVLQAAAPDDARAAMLLGSWYYDKRRYADAITAWERAIGSSDPQTATIAHRNLGIAAYNVQHDRGAALEHFEAARALAPRDAKLLYEYDQLLARTGSSDAARLGVQELQLDLVLQRDDLTVQHALLLTSVGRATEARDVILGRRFQPWEGGEGQVLAAWDGAMRALASEHPDRAVEYLEAAIAPPATLGEARHPLANAADLFSLLGDAFAARGMTDSATAAWQTAAGFTGDFLNMSEQPYSAQTVHSIRALRRLGRNEEADTIARGLAEYVEQLAVTPAAVDYFATSLPTMLLFHDDPQELRDREVAQLRTQLTALDPGAREPAAPAAPAHHTR